MSTTLFVDNVGISQRAPVNPVNAGSNQPSTNAVDRPDWDNEPVSPGTEGVSGSQNTSVNEPSQNFDNTLDQKIAEQQAQDAQTQAPADTQSEAPADTQSEAPADTQSEAPAETPNQASDVPDKPKDVVDQWKEDFSETVEESKDAAASKMEQGAGHELAQLLAEAKGENAAAVPVTALGVKVDETKTPKETETGQLGIKIGLPAKSEGEIGLKEVLPVGAETQQKGQETALADTASQTPNGETQSVGGETQSVGGETQSVGGETQSVGGETRSAEVINTVMQSTNETVVSKNSPVNAENSASETVGNTTPKGTVGEQVPVADKLGVGEQPVEQKNTVFDNVIAVAADKNSSPEQPVDLQQNMPADPGSQVVKNNKPSEGKASTEQQQDGQPLSESSSEESKGQASGLAGEPIAGNVKAEEIQVITDSSSGNNTTNSDSNNGSQSSSGEFAQIIAGGNSPLSVTSQTASTAQTAKANTNVASQDLSAGIKEQVQESISSTLKQGDNQITIHLNPPELGRVSIKFQEQDGQLTGLLEVDKAQTRYEIEHSLPEIIRNLTDSGVQIRRVEVVLNEQSNQQSFKEPSLMTTEQEGQGQAGYQGSTDSTSRDNNGDWSGTYEQLRSGELYSGSNKANWQVSEDFINMLV